MPIIQLVKERAVALNLMTESSTFRSNGIPSLSSNMSCARRSDWIFIDGDQEAGGEDIEERVLAKTERYVHVAHIVPTDQTAD